MKNVLLFIMLTFFISHITHSQELYNIYGKSDFGVDYYFNDDANGSSYAEVDNDGIYSIAIDCNSNKSITISIPGKDDVCAQTLDINGLCGYINKMNTDRIENDLTHLLSFICVNEDQMLSEMRESYTGSSVENNYRLLIFENKTFNLTYTENSQILQKQGYCNDITKNNITLNSVVVKNVATNTYINDDQTIELKRDSGRLIWEDKDNLYFVPN